MRDTLRYGFITLLPLTLMLLAATVDGAFAYAALLWLTLVAAALDVALPRPSGPDEAPDSWGARLPMAIAIGHLILLPAVLLALASPALSPGEKIALFFAAASFVGQVSHPSAHELIHGKSRLERGLGTAIYISIGYGHHVPAHRMVHHAHVGTYKDPNTPLPGESFWGFLPRAWAEEFQAGLRAEEAGLERKGHGPRNRRNIYWTIIAGEAVALVVAAVATGPVGVLAYLCLWLLAGSQILMSDYLQHYGLQRLELPSGRVEPVGPHHSWDAPRGFTSYLMMNAPSHSEHHMHPGRSYASLGPGIEAPRLPAAMPVMAMIAMIPSLWHRMMDPRALAVMEAAEARIAATHGATETQAECELGQAAHQDDVEVGPEDDLSWLDGPDADGADTGLETEECETEGPAAPAIEIAATEKTDEALIARVQGMVARTEQSLLAASSDLTSLKLRRPVRSARRAALRDR